MKAQGLYDPAFEHDACGVGFIANINGDRRHSIVSDGLTILKNLEHRGALGGDLKTGDGAGILTQLPHAFFSAQVPAKVGSSMVDGGYGVGMLFLPQDQKKRQEAEYMIATVTKSLNGQIIHWRDVPTNPDCLGELARTAMPCIRQVFVIMPGFSGEELERRLYVLRKSLENEAIRRQWPLEDFYIASLSGKTIVYKGMFLGKQIPLFYPDVCDQRFVSALALIHARYSTNTFPSWPLAQPFRSVAHNGEINTLRGNINKMNARENTLKTDLFGEDLARLFPIVNTAMSDSGIFDTVFELLAMSGRTVEHAMMMMVPEAFGPKYHISEDKRAFYEYHASMMEPWDGPAALAFTDGVKIGATLDRNGLRPARYVITKQGTVVLASEVGVLDIAPEDVLEKGRLAPGKMLLVDTARGRIARDNEIKASVSRRQPYRRWLEQNRIELKGLFEVPGPVPVKEASLVTRQRMFGYSLEDVKMIIAPMAENAQEPVGSMGNDATLAVLSENQHLLYNYFKQLFAQVTNPPIDPYRENLVMSLMSFIGKEGNLLEETPQHCHQLKLPHPVLSNDDMEKIRAISVGGMKSVVFPMLFDAASGERGLESALDVLCREVEDAVDKGCTLAILSDREADETRAPIPALLATAAVHHHLIRTGKRQLGGLIIESAEPREVMHFATLIGYGASAINPYLAFETLSDLNGRGWLPDSLSLESAIENYIIAVKKGLLKVMSKMGVSTIRSYRGAQIFEAIGLNTAFVNTYFPGTASRIEGVGIRSVGAEALMRHRAAFAAREFDEEWLESGGVYHLRTNAERHRLTPEVISLVHRAVRLGDYGVYKQYAAAVNDTSERLCTVRGLFRFKKGAAVAVDDVEPVDEIVKRFVSSAMSFGSISKEAHETIAIAMNRLGAQSNSGEGGEDEIRYQPLPNGDSSMSSIKQVASARFGVTINYLANSRELQIKMAQGAKPGEGGQLSGAKVDDTIAKVRHSTPGVTLISPPPHHDIYSIEDLAQLIFDLKNANPAARVSVKLVSEVGVGTIAAGVAKGRADMVLISGYDGGTGNSPISSIKHAGAPWEIGLAEAQQVLVMNKLRDKIRVQTDGQLRTGRDIAVAALLGAEEYGFGTISLVCMGCVMMRKCHLNTCPVGVATQDPLLRQRFTGKPEHLINFMRFVAQDLREIMAELGFRKVDDMIGRVDMLEVDGAIDHWKAKGLDYSKLLAMPDVPEGSARRCIATQNIDLSNSLDQTIIEQGAAAIAEKKKVLVEMPIRNCNRTVGATLSYTIAKKYGSAGLPEDTLTVEFEGSAGQSFGAFLAPGVTFELEGDANDYVAKGLSGGKIVVYPPDKATFQPQNNILIGNVALFGATSGEVYLNGMAGERFAVRNSGALSVVEGVGDHGCEYMTGGRVVVLGSTGVNFAAGMSGGIAYVLDESQLFDTRCNLEMVELEPVTEERDKTFLKNIITRHVRYTNSALGKRILDQWTESLPLFVKVMPVDYRQALQKLRMGDYNQAEFVAMTEEVFN